MDRCEGMVEWCKEIDSRRRGSITVGFAIGSVEKLTVEIESLRGFEGRGRLSKKKDFISSWSDFPIQYLIRTRSRAARILPELAIFP